MHDVRILIRDATRNITTVENREFAEIVTLALSALPESIAELDRALARFLDLDAWPGFAAFAAESNDQPGSGGLLIADLAARLLVLDLASVEPPAGNHTDDEHADAPPSVRYRLPDDWLVLQES